MNFPGIKYLPYEIKLKEPFITSGRVIEKRKGFFICISSGGENEIAWGEAAPLPEFGSETYSEAERALNEQFGLLPNKEGIIEPDLFETKLSEIASLPALSHGLEQAWLGFRALKENTSLDRFLSVKLKRSVSLNGLIGLMSPGEALLRAQMLVEQGFKTLKLKAGRSDFSEDRKSLEAIRSHFGDKIKLRLDVNGKWQFCDALNYVKELEEFNLEYIEQPVLGKEDFFNLAKISPVALAADEIIRNSTEAFDAMGKNPGIVLILKPMMLGGIRKTLQILKAAEASGVKAVISSSFETSLGRAMLVFLAASLNSSMAHGIATKDFLESEPFQDPFEIKDGSIESGSALFHGSLKPRSEFFKGRFLL
ncbi:MAG: o-succinylbenzoate synthase [Ignavibacteria bacterium]|jgi:o-succinylbenzoate synthase|nr:o-succinylbenzoate synthase [Ignavibacteria bacterium]MCU7504136.1 o-succinylbenzoate synthase [Ignavibacteria bacterium]MCU7516414.1 o-succinylbenzoate synthase [Ignavibacteria bacterium]